jgi:tRNA-Thr(GGU) m(6)t(6)A37 methyltransferase TsaA
MTEPPPETVTYRPIGVIRSPHTDRQAAPIQPLYARGAEGRAEIAEAYADGLADLEGFSHLILLYHFHRAGGMKLRVTPFLEDAEHGVFATRAPCRPNPIGLSVVRLLRREGRVLHLADVDVLDGTPLLDVKPYVARFDRRDDVRSGWQDRVDEGTAESRGRRETGGPGPLA